MGKKWSPEEIKELIILRAKKTDFPEIARRLNKKFWSNKAVRTDIGVSRYLERKHWTINKCWEIANAEADEDKSNIETQEKYYQLLKENRHLIEELSKERLKTGKILNAIRGAIIKLPPYKPSIKKKVKRGFDSEDMALALSDIQIGQKQTFQDTSGLSEYNFEILLKETDILKEKVELIFDIQSQAYDISRLWVLGLGDYIEGEAIFPGQAHYLDHIVVNQVFEGTQVNFSTLSGGKSSTLLVNSSKPTVHLSTNSLS